MNLKITIGLIAAFAATLHAAPRSSSNYTIATDTADAGGSRAASADYTHDGSLGGIVGVSTVASPVEIAKAGYIGQLYEVVGLSLSAAPENVNEGATLQLAAAQLLDDSTVLAIAATSVGWSVAAGPLTAIDAAGEGTAEVVYENTAATAQGTYEGSTNQLGLMVLNVNSDDYGTYAGDGLDDDWQNLYFGLDNPNAAPSLDPDADGQDNTFEFIAGLIPTDSMSRFRFHIEGVPAQSTNQNLVFSPRFNDRTYTVEQKSDLTGGTWDPLAPSSSSDSLEERTVTDLDATGATRFYRVGISKP
jgi:hypothetical protein